MGETLRPHAKLSHIWLCVAPYSLPGLGLLFRRAPSMSTLTLKRDDTRMKSAGPEN